MSAPHTLEPSAAHILRSIPEGLIYCDLEGIIRMWNGGAEKIFGWSAAEAVGQNLDMIIPERMRKAHWDGFHQALARGGVKPGRTSMITRSLHKSEEFIYIDMSFEMVHGDAGEMLGSLAVVRDATKRFNDEKALRKQLAELTPPKPAA